MIIPKKEQNADSKQANGETKRALMKSRYQKTGRLQKLRPQQKEESRTTEIKT